MENSFQKAAHIILKARHLSAFTGSGISFESGIPTFRGENGLWTKYDPELFDISYFTANPAESWKLLKKLFFESFAESKPNDAHFVLSRLEQKGFLKIIITQNIDNLHFEAGSKNVVEYHGNSQNLICIACRKMYVASPELIENLPPVCECGGILKPDMVFFGEEIPGSAVVNAQRALEKTDAMLVVGTTGEVYPASMIPIEAKRRGAEIIEVNIKPSSYTNEITDIFFQGKATVMLNELEREIDSYNP